MDKSPPTFPTSTRRPAIRWRQRRGEPRRPCHAEVEILSPVAGRGVAINVSESGMRIAVDCQLKEGAWYVIRIDETPGRYERVRVVWLREVRDGWIAGLEFIGMH